MCQIIVAFDVILVWLNWYKTIFTVPIQYHTKSKVKCKQIFYCSFFFNLFYNKMDQSDFFATCPNAKFSPGIDVRLCVLFSGSDRWDFLISILLFIVHLFQAEPVYRVVNNGYVGPAVPYNCKQLRSGRYVYDLLYYNENGPDYSRDELNVPEHELARESEIRPQPLGGASFFQRRNRNIM